jgi:hypothetical protein
MMAGLLSLMALPATAATERIPLTFTSPALMVQMLTGAPQSPDGGGLSGGGLLAEGISALAATTSPNALVVDGTPEAIAHLRQIIRLIDIPPRKIRLSVRVFPKANIPFDPKNVTIHNDKLTPSTAQLSAEELATLLKNAPAPLMQAQVEGNNNQPALFYWTPPGKKRETATVFPRVNGDDSVTVFLRSGNQPGPHIKVPVKQLKDVVVRPEVPGAENLSVGDTAILRMKPGPHYMVTALPNTNALVVMRVEAEPVRNVKVAGDRKTVATRRR